MTEPARRPRFNRWALLVTGISLVFWGTWHMARTQCHPYGDLSCGVFSDHFSHMNTGRLFTRVGIGIWTRPLIDNGRPLTDEERAELPEDLQPVPPNDMRAIPGWPADKPFVSSWGAGPRFHPPGDMLVTAPVGALYSWTSLSFSWATKLLILLFLVYAHVSIYLLIASAVRNKASGAVGFLVLFILYWECVHWALEGFYEPLVIAPLILCGRYLYERRGLAAVVAYSAAAFLHFRALFLLPMGLYGLYLVIDQREWENWRRRDYLLAAAAVFMGGWALLAFILVWPYLRVLSANSSVAVLAESASMSALVTFAIVASLIAAAFVWARAWLDLAVLACTAAILLLARQAYPWDVVSLLAWLAIPVVGASSDRLAVVRDARFVAVLFIAAAILGNSLTPVWLNQVFT